MTMFIRLCIRSPATCESAFTTKRRVIRPVCRHVLTIISVKILHKCDETSLTVTHIAVSLTLKWQVALKA